MLVAWLGPAAGAFVCVAGPGALGCVEALPLLLDGPEPLLRHLGLSEADTYITKHDIDDLVTVVRIIREEAPAWQH